jgi:hypothetical protein
LIKLNLCRWRACYAVVIKPENSVLRIYAVLLVAFLSWSAVAQQSASSFVGRWAGEVPGVGGAILVITQVRPEGRVEGRMEFELQSHVSSFGEQFHPGTNTSHGLVNGSTLVIEAALGGLYQLSLEGGALAGTYSRGTTYRVPVRFSRL